MIETTRSKLGLSMGAYAVCLLMVFGSVTACNGGSADSDASLDAGQSVDGALRVDMSADMGEVEGPQPDGGRIRDSGPPPPQPDGGPPMCQPDCGGRTCGPDGCGGRCGVGCGDGELCVDGNCSREGCPPNTFECGGDCADLLSDPEHCGNCATRCPSQAGTDSECLDAECYLTCPETRGERRSIDLNSDPDHCGQCGNRCPMAEGGERGCVDGVCLDPCAPRAQCDGQCVDLQRDEANCGACGNTCPDDASCRDGVCDCNGGGQEICDEVCTPMGTLENCAGCGDVCQGAEGGRAACEGRQCQNPCRNGEPCDGVCQPTQTALAHCGACNANCTEVASDLNAGAGCDLDADACEISAGHCTDGSCTMLRRLTWELRNREVGQTTCTEVCTLAGMRCTARPANIEACPQYDVQDGPDVIQRDLGDMARVGCASWSYNLRGYGLAVIDDCDREVNFTFQNRRDGARLNTIVCACDLQ